MRQCLIRVSINLIRVQYFGGNKKKYQTRGAVPSLYPCNLATVQHFIVVTLLSGNFAIGLQRCVAVRCRISADNQCSVSVVGLFWICLQPATKCLRMGCKQPRWGCRLQVANKPPNLLKHK